MNIAAKKHIGKDKRTNCIRIGSDSSPKTYYEAWKEKRPQQKSKERRTPALMIRFQEAQNFLLEKYEEQQFIPIDDGKRIILITWLLTDPDAEKADLGITEFEKWSWEPIDDITKLSRGYANFLFFHGGKVYSPWMNLVRIAWAKLSEREQNNISNTKSNQIVGETFTLAGIPINRKNLLAWIRRLHGWKKFVVYGLLLLSAIFVFGYYTRTFWTPLINRVRGNSNDINGSSAESKLPRSLKELCQDIDSRPLVQREDTAKSYIGIRVENERLILFNAQKLGIEQDFHLTMMLPEEWSGQRVIGRYIVFSVKKEKYPELVAAKQGLEIYVSGRIEYVGPTYIKLSEVLLGLE